MLGDQSSPSLLCTPTEVVLDLDVLQQYETAGDWQAAADLMQGDFLEGICLAENLEFDTWLLTEREHWRQRAQTILSHAIDASIQQAAYTAALERAHQLLHLMPWHEATHRQVMRLLAWSDQRAAALHQYQLCVEILQTELGVPPDPATTQLFEEIREGKMMFPASVHTTPSPPWHNLPAQTTPFIGRDQELTELSRLLNEPSVRLITIFGPGGMGKTRLALAAAQQFLETTHHRIGFVDLAPLAPANDIVPAIAEGSGLSLPTG
ncbi:MAG: BTAD domain-containing putative transcriptional regulator [Caldilineaceae bacterium]